MIRKKSNSVSVSTDISNIINLNNAKIVASVLMIIFSVYHLSIILKLDNNSCKYLLRDGQFQSNYNWQPYGCMMHNYSTKDSQNCLKYVAYWGGINNIIFVGDMYLNDFYQSLSAQVSGEAVKNDYYKSNHNKKYYNKDLSMNSIFNDVMEVNLTNLHKSPYIKSSIKKSKPNLIISFGLEIFNTSVNATSALKEYQRLLMELAKGILSLKDTKIIWILLEYNSYETNQDLYDYAVECNSLAVNILEPLGVLMWKSNIKIYQQLVVVTRSSDEVYIRSLIPYWYVQIYLNLYCNDIMKFYDGTCCSKGEEITNTQMATLLFFTLWTVIAAYCFFYDRFCLNSMNRNETRKTKPFIPTHHRTGSDLLPINTSFFISLYEVSFTMMKLGVILGYFFICDRTIFFMKENKTYTMISFLLPLGYIFIVGIFFSDNSHKVVCGVLNRDITDEWKGWLQCVILVYHITGASKILPIYFMIRFCVSSYLFMTGYGHFSYFWRKGDVSLRRFVMVLYKLNFLTFCLCFTMNRAYQLYYFVPLVSVSFITIYILFVMCPLKSVFNKGKWVVITMFIKLVFLIVAVSFLYSYDTIFEKLFFSNPLRALFVVSEDYPNDWKFRWGLDRYSCIAGMMFALIYHTLKTNNIFADNHSNDVFSIRASFILFAFGIISILMYFIFAICVPEKSTGVHLHPYIVVLPVIGYVVVRNVFGAVRKKFSLFFAWIGKISLEVYISQYHIWLAADAHGVLVLLPGYPILNLLLTTFVFFCVSHELHNLTLTLLPYAIPDSWRGVLRNVFLLILILLPLGISHGVLSLI